MKILCYKLLKHEAFHLYVSKHVYSNCLSLKIFNSHTSQAMRLYTYMCLQMNFHFTFCLKSFQEFFTNIKLFICVNFHFAFCRKSFHAYFTNMKLFTRMCQKMNFHFTLSKSFLACFTNIRLFTCVCPEMVI